MSLGGMFGGGGGGSQTTNQTTRVEYSPEETAARNEIFATGRGLYGQSAPTAGVYQGPKPVGYSDPSLYAFGTQLNTANQAAGSAGNAISALNFGLNNAKDVNANPYLQGAIGAAIQPQVQNFTSSILPALRLGAVQDGSFNGTRQGVAEGVAARGLGNQIQNTAMSMANTGYNTGLDTSTSLLKSLPVIMQGLFAPAQAMSSVGSALETQQQQEENYAAAQRLQTQNGPWQLLQNWASLMGGMSNPTTTTTGTTNRSDTGISGGQALGGMLSLLSLFL